MKKIFLIIILNLMFVCNVANATTVTFVDIDEHWAEENIMMLAKNGIISGYSDSTFKPENEITIMEFVKMLIEAGNYKLIRKGTCIYPDFYYETAISNEIIFEGIDVSKKMTRYEMVDIISRFIDVSDVKESRNKFKDLKQENKSNVLKLSDLKVINGYKDKTFRGENNVTRAEAVTVIINALKAKNNRSSSAKYDLRIEKNLSNYLSDTKSLVKPFYEIEDNQILIHDVGRYARLDNYKVKADRINIANIIKIIENLINPNAYVAVLYIPSTYTINELKICYGKDEDKALCGDYDFVFTYYENDTYELATKSLNDIFSNNCYLRIDLVDIYDNDKVNKSKKERLLNALKVEFGSNANRILTYMLKKCRNYENNIKREEVQAEKQTFGNYIINYYQKENGIPQFYIERK